jgi:DNA-binding MarR family transcriptional regulator
MATVSVTAEDSLALANRLRPVLVHLNRHLRREVHKLGVSAGQVSVLATIRDHPGIGIADLATREGTSAPSISTHINRLEASGLVARGRSASTDRRRIGLSITAEGLGVLRAVRSRRTAWLAARLASLAPAERQAVGDAIDALDALVRRV